jgi:hypothetical protein
MPTRPDIEVEKNPILQKPKMKDGKIVRYNPRDRASVGLAPTGGYMELGLTTVDDFSMTMDCKGGICGSDLQAVYGENHENWEDSVARDSSLYSKYNDETKPEKKMNQLKSARDSKYFEDFDPQVQRQIDEEERQKQQMQKIKEMHLRKQDAYYDEYANRMLGAGDSFQNAMMQRNMETRTLNNNDTNPVFVPPQVSQQQYHKQNIQDYRYFSNQQYR